MRRMSQATALPIEVEGLTRPITEEEAQQLIADDPVAAAYLILVLSREVLRLKHPEASSPSAPPSSVPVYAKPRGKSSRTGRDKRGAKPGHVGRGRGLPERVDKVVAHHLEACPRCGGPVTPLKGPSGIRVRIIEDLPSNLQSEVSEHTIHRCYCASCRQTVEPVVPDALPNSKIGHRLMAFTAWLRFGVGVTLSNIQQVLNTHLQFPLSSGGIVDSGQRLAQILLPWYEDIRSQVLAAGTLHADETGWRVFGRTHWLWCFCTSDATYYRIEQSRGSPVLTEFFAGAFDGVLVTDFWAPYKHVLYADRQVCLAHLFRELDATSRKDSSAQWRGFHACLKRLLKDALRLKRTTGGGDNADSRKRYRLELRLDQIIQDWRDSSNDDVRRLVKRLVKYERELLTFLDYPDVPADNNLAEREVRPAVILRKNSHGNQSERGAVTQGVLMTVFRTLKRRGHNPLETIANALQHYTTTGQLPPLPNKAL